MRFTCRKRKSACVQDRAETVTSVMAEEDVLKQKMNRELQLQITLHGVLTTYPEPCLPPHKRRHLIQIVKPSTCKVVLSIP